MASEVVDVMEFPQCVEDVVVILDQLLVASKPE